MSDGVTDPVDIIAARNEYFKGNRIAAFYHRKHPDYPEFRYPNPLQEKLLEAWKDPRYKVFTYSGGNRIGKTFCGGLNAGGMPYTCKL